MAPIETDPRNPYAAPRAELDLAPPSGTLPANIAGAVAGQYDFTVGDVMDEAWKLVKGMKGAFWSAGILIGIIYLVVDTLASLVIRAAMGGEPSLIVSSLYNGLVGALLTPLAMGMHMIASVARSGSRSRSPPRSIISPSSAPRWRPGCWSRCSPISACSP